MATIPMLFLGMLLFGMFSDRKRRRRRIDSLRDENPDTASSIILRTAATPPDVPGLLEQRDQVIARVNARFRGVVRQLHADGWNVQCDIREMRIRELNTIKREELANAIYDSVASLGFKGVTIPYIGVNWPIQEEMISGLDSRT
jgi:hypothetical protein